MTTSSLTIALVSEPNCGTAELKDFIRKNTLRGFFITVGTIMLVFLASFIVGKFATSSIEQKIGLGPNITIHNYNLSQTSDQPEAIPQFQKIPDLGTIAQAGIPVPVPDLLIKPDMVFASVETMAKSSSKRGELVFVPDNVLSDENKQLRIDAPIEILPGEHDFIDVEKEPSIDLEQLQQRLEYPQLAIRIGTQGKVVIRVLVGTDGKPKRNIVEYSDSEILNPAAQEAVMESIFTPAVQNGKAIPCWVSIPIQFRLK